MGFREWMATNFYNDAVLIPVYLYAFFAAMVVLVAAIWFHELGHWLWFRIAKKRIIKIRFVKKNWFNFHWLAGEEKDYEDLTKKEYNRMLMTGVMMGLLPILIAGFIWSPLVLMVIPYGVGAWGDIKEASKDVKLED